MTWSEDHLDAPEEHRNRRAWIEQLIGYTLAAAGLIWVLRDVHPREAFDHSAVDGRVGLQSPGGSFLEEPLFS
jgi:hypothetical protein